MENLVAFGSLLILFLITGCFGEFRSFSFESREVSLEFWNTAAITRKFRSNIACAAAVNLESSYTAFLYRDDGTCEMAFVDNLTPNTSPLVKVKLQVSSQVDGVNIEGVNVDGVNSDGVNVTGVNIDEVNTAGVNGNDVNITGANVDGVNVTGANVAGVNVSPTKLCPVTHPFPFLGGKSCCQTNVESPYVGVTTGTRGFLTINSTTCTSLVLSVPYSCTDGYLCLRNPIIGNSLQVLSADINPASYRDFSSPTVGGCQQTCEDETECQAWVWMVKGIFGMYCWLVKGGPTMKYNLIATAGFKSSYINVPFE